jgi:hypothetical protein
MDPFRTILLVSLLVCGTYARRAHSLPDGHSSRLLSFKASRVREKDSGPNLAKTVAD